MLALAEWNVSGRSPAPTRRELYDLLALVREMRIAQRRAAQANDKRSGWKDEARRLQAAVDRELGILNTEV